MAVCLRQRAPCTSFWQARTDTALTLVNTADNFVEALSLSARELRHDVPIMRWSGPGGELEGLHLVHCPAFADEMNKSRHLVAAAARLFASEGATVWVPDLLGTGDSAAEFASADWLTWVAELQACVEAAKADGAQSIALWGNRLGALLATEVATKLEDPELLLLLWQPVLSGEQFVRQFLRVLNVKASTSGASAQAPLADTASDGELLDVAGYRLTPSLIADIKSVSLPSLDQIPCVALMAFETSPVEGKSLSPKVQRWLGASAGSERTLSGVCQGDLYWASQELGYADDLLDASLRALCDVASRCVPTGTEPDASGLESAVSLSPSADTFVFPGAGEQLVGHIRSAANISPAGVGVILVVGGPQYRAGSHRLFIKLASAFASAGYPALCFDHRGMGDSSGASPGFEHIGPELKGAIDAFQTRCPDVRRVVLWGLCDGATASGLFARHDSRVAGLILANPWVYSEGAKAAALLETHYKSRLLSAEFWKRLLTGKVNVSGALVGFFSVVLKRLQRDDHTDASSAELPESAPLADRLFFALMRGNTRVKILLSEHDITAAEFDVALRRHEESAVDGHRLKELASFTRLTGADHTFSMKVHTDTATMESVAVLDQWFNSDAEKMSNLDVA